MSQSPAPSLVRCWNLCSRILSMSAMTICHSWALWRPPSRTTFQGASHVSASRARWRARHTCLPTTPLKCSTCCGRSRSREVVVCMAQKHSAHCVSRKVMSLASSSRAESRLTMPGLAKWPRPRNHILAACCGSVPSWNVKTARGLSAYFPRIGPRPSKPAAFCVSQAMFPV